MNQTNIRKYLQPLIITILWLAIWQILYLIVGRELIIPSPFGVLKTILQLAGTGIFWGNIALSLLRILIGYLAALLVGSLIAFLCAHYQFINAFLSPISKIIRATPVASFIILLFVFMTKSHIPAFTSFLMVFPVVWTNVYEGIRSCDPSLLEMAAVFQVPKGQIRRKILLPSLMPYFMAAAKTGMGLAWKAGIAAEVLTSPRYGIGAALYRSKVYLETTETFAWTVVIVLISVILEKFFVRLITKFQGNRL